MIKRVIEISETAARLSLRRGQVLAQTGDVVRTFPAEDVGMLILQHPRITVTTAVLNEVAKAGGVVILCDSRHLPSATLLPAVTHTELGARFERQLKAGKPIRKKIWKQVVKAKVFAQAEPLDGREMRRLRHLAETVRSGDPKNHEAQAARIYWRARFPKIYADGDRRDPTDEGRFNSLLNYGYAIIRASVARAIVGAGLQPVLGIHHRNIRNPFCLADDLMEPLRPLVDDLVFDLLRGPDAEDGRLTREDRQMLLGILQQTVGWGDTHGPLMATLPRFIGSFYRVLIGADSRLVVPTRAR